MILRLEKDEEITIQSPDTHREITISFDEEEKAFNAETGTEKKKII